MNVGMGTFALPRTGIKSTFNRYAAGALAALLVLGVRQLLAPVLGTELLYTALWPAVVFSSWYCGAGPAVVTVVVGIAGVWYWFEPHLHGIELQHSSTEITSLTGFLVVSALVIVMGESNRRVRERERKITEEVVAATAKFQAVFQQTTVFAGIMTLDGKVIDANQLCLEACGYRAEEVLGRNFWETGWWRDMPEVQDKIHAATSQAAAGISFRETLPYYWADGSKRHVDFALHPIRDDNGKVIFLHSTGVDITDLKNAEENYRVLAHTLEEQVRVRTEELEQRTQQLRDLSRRLMQTQDEERRRIARELHDSAGQVLAALGMSLQTILLEAGSSAPQLTGSAQESFELSQQLSQQIRTMSYLLHPPLLDELGLSAALEWYVKGLMERSGIEISLSMPDPFPRLTSELELAVFRVVQECLTNIHRHSESKTAAIRLSVDGNRVLLEVSDAGKGIPPQKLSQIQAHATGVGMQGMRERFRPFDGTMQIDSNDLGTKISVTFKIPGFAARAGSN